MEKSRILFILLLAFASQTLAQRTVGLLSYDPVDSYDGYNLIYPHNQPDVLLLNNCGEVVHRWEGEVDSRPGNTAYILEDGRIVKTQRPASVAGNPIWAGGGGGTVEIRDWNGNILMISWELKTQEEALQAGRDTALLNQEKLWPDYILEVNPATDEIVWEWHVWDHLIQDFDDTKDNFGVVSEHPELVNLNWDTNNGMADWMHSNALDYNEELDHIMISVPTFHEIWVIDHSTTTAQAASSTGGNSGRGGDLLYRWGNPATYNLGTEEDQKLFYQHDAHWVDDFLSPAHPYYGQIAVFNNRVGEDFSQVNLWESSWDMYKGSYLSDDDVFLPFNYSLTIQHPDPQELYSTGLSSFQVLPNGNFLICSGRFGYSFEITPEDEIVWEYKTPFLAGAPVSQGDTLAINNNLTFRLVRYPLDYAAFDGQDLSEGEYLELNPDSLYCDLVLPVNEIDSEYQLKLFPNPSNGSIILEWEKMGMVDIELIDMLGVTRKKFTGMGGRKYLDLSAIENGIYFVRIGQQESQKLIIQR